MVKRYDRAVHDTIVAFHAGTLEPGTNVMDLANGGVDYATSGGFIDHLVPQLERLKADIVADRIEVPTVPDAPPRLAWKRSLPVGGRGTRTFRRLDLWTGQPR
jgi:basic membrane lipoprotein Med (substrate-binding protein (PBP1-ABC) superfamily)